MQKQYFISMAVLEPWVEYCSQKFSRFFVAVVSAEIEVQNCMHSSTSACIEQWARSYVASQGDPLAFAQYVLSVKYGEKKAIMSGGDSDSGSLSPSCTTEDGNYGGEGICLEQL